MLDPESLKRTSKFLSLVLRHQPQLIGIELDSRGWTDVDTLIRQSTAHGMPLDPATLHEVVTTNAKKRFRLNEAGDRIRASQGHSVAIDAGYEPADPPETLYHGTSVKHIDAIFSAGIKRMDRTHVHLSMLPDDAVEVGKRHGKPVVLEVSSGKMACDGFQFFRSENGIWLTVDVPVGYFSIAPAN